MIENYKLSRYIFPKHDRGPTNAGLQNIKPIQTLEYIVNLCLHRVPRDLKLVWDDLAGRDSFYPEISKIGMQSTRYDLRQRSELYKRKKDKRLYVESLRHDKKGNSRDLQGKEAKLNLAGNSNENVCTGILPNSGQECAKLQGVTKEGSKSPLSTNSLVTSLQISALDNIRTLPTDLLEFKDFCQENKMNIHEGWAKIYFTERKTFLVILKSIILIAPNKRTKNKPFNK